MSDQHEGISPGIWPLLVSLRKSYQMPTLFQAGRYMDVQYSLDPSTLQANVRIYTLTGLERVGSILAS